MEYRYFRYAFPNEEENENGGTMEYFRYVGRGVFVFWRRTRYFSATNCYNSGRI